ncbi:MAG: recombination-associated protein RdgC [Legionellales bacterium]|nr:recombination-associated protein RdgC [Legionellales bacterium]
MWFNNALIYHYELDSSCDLPTSLDSESLKPCPPHARFIYGWLPVQNEHLAHETAACSLICMGKEERILPRGVIQQLLEERILVLETERGQEVRRSERSQMAEELEFELLPKSFCLQKRLPAILDTLTNRLIINTASQAQASQLMTLLRKSIPSIRITPVNYIEQMSLRFASWINNPSLLPSSFQLASDCLLFSLDDERKRFTCKGYELPAEEIVTLLSQGLAAAELSIIWNERIQFTLTQDLTFKRIKCLDYLTDEFQEIHELKDPLLEQDASLTLLAGELRGLINDVVSELGEDSAMTHMPPPPIRSQESLSVGS